MATLKRRQCHMHRPEPWRLAIAIGAFILMTTACAGGAGVKTDQMRQSLAQGSVAAAGQQSEAALSAAEATGDSRNVANALDNAGLVALAQGDQAKAERQFREALALRQSAKDAAPTEMARSHLNLGLVALRRGSLGDAQRELEKGLAILSTGRDPDSVLTTAALRNTLAEVAIHDGRLAEAMNRLEAAARDAKGASGHADEAGIRFAIEGNRARIARARGDFRGAIDQFERLLAAQKAGLPPGNTAIAVTLNNLAEILVELGDSESARRHYLDALRILEQAQGSSGDIAIVTGNLAQLSNALGKPAEAAELASKALALQEKSLGVAHPGLGPTLSILADIAYRSGNMADAERYNSRALGLYEAAFGPDHPQMLAAVLNAGELERRRNRPAEAEALYQRAKAIIERAFGRDSLQQVTLLAHQAELALAKKDFAEATRLYQDGLAIGRRILGTGHPRLVRLLIGLAEAERLRGDRAASIGAFKLALAALGQRPAGMTTAESHQATNVYLRYLTLLSEQGRQPEAIEESFKAAQLLGFTRTAKAIAQMSARLSIGSDALAGALRARQDAIAGLRQTEDNLVSAAARPLNERDLGHLAQLQGERSGYVAAIAQADSVLAATFPDFSELENAQPASLSDIRQQLSPGSAMLVYAVTPAGVWGWAIGRNEASFRQLSPDQSALARSISDLRQGLDPFAAPETDGHGLPARFPAALAFQIHQDLVAPFMPALGEAETLYVVPSGPLHSMPLEILLTTPPKEAWFTTADNYRRADWLARRFAIAYLPAASSLLSLKASRGGSNAGTAFLGIGDPLLRDHPGEGSPSPGAASQQVAARAAAAASDVFRGSHADPDLIAALPSLPETAGELSRMHDLIGGGELMLRGNASETALKARHDLADFSIVAFATHGLVAGDMNGLTEPGLVLTPPAVPGDLDDGFLSSSDVAGLTLNADWVVLSACNTAAPDGSPEAESLSGLARAFFYAGVRSLLVSHWPVASGPTVELTTAIIADVSQGKIGRAKAHQHAMLVMIDGANDLNPHPTIWAPFVVVGDGE